MKGQEPTPAPVAFSAARSWLLSEAKATCFQVLVLLLLASLCASVSPVISSLLKGFSGELK